MSTPEPETWGAFDDPAVVAAREFCHSVAMEPMPADRYAWDRWNMAQVHTVLMNRLEATYKNASHIAPNDFPTYWAVARADVHFVDEHHISEDEFYFPFLGGGELMRGNTQQHEEFIGQVQQTLAYLDSVSPSNASSAAFSASAFRATIDAWLARGCAHMVDELTTLEADRLQQAGVTVRDLEQAIASVAKHRGETEDRWYALPALVYATPAGCRFPSEAPWFVPRVVGPALAYAAGWGRMKYFWSARRWENTPANAPS